MKITDRAYNGLEAFTKVKDAHQSGSHVYGLILTDISMPIMDGFEEAENIRNYYQKHGVQQPMIVACTGHVEDAYINKAWRHEIDEVVPKPVNVTILKEIFAEIFDVEVNKKRGSDTNATKSRRKSSMKSAKSGKSKKSKKETKGFFD